jgi:hypothetical protein
MDEEYRGLTLEGLAQRLEALERENAGLRDKLAAFTDSVRDGDAAVARKTARSFEGPVSRRALLSKAGAAAVAAAAAGILLNPREAQAADFREPVLVSTEDDANRTQLGVTYASGIKIAVYGRHSAGTGVYGVGIDGVQGESRANGFSGVYGRHNAASNGPGVTGDGKGNWPGVWGRNPAADGVTGETEGEGKSGVYGRHLGLFFDEGFGVTGDGNGPGGAGVLGRNPNGYGGQFEGGRAQLKLKPAGSAGPPTGAHTKGEIYMDSQANLFVCFRSGNPAGWRKVSTTAV